MEVDRLVATPPSSAPPIIFVLPSTHSFYCPLHTSAHQSAVDLLIMAGPPATLVSLPLEVSSAPSCCSSSQIVEQVLAIIGEEDTPSLARLAGTCNHFNATINVRIDDVTVPVR